jgi:hypothetical protein
MVENLWQKAKQSLRVAELAYQNGCYDEAVSRSYFAVLKGALALMASLGLRPKETSRIGYWVQAHFANECIHRRIDACRKCPHPCRFAVLKGAGGIHGRIDDGADGTPSAEDGAGIFERR